MKQIILFLLLFTFTSIQTIAQVKEKHHETHNISENIDTEAHAMMYADKVATRLGLNLEQKDKIQQAQMKRLENEKKLKYEMMSQSGEMHKTKMKANEDEFKAEMKTILTPTQYEKWLTMYKREKQKHY